MIALDASALLGVWERGRHSTPPRRALLVLGAACPGTAPEDLEALPVGRRDDRILAVRGLTFGPDVESVVDCPSCDERLEFAFTVDDLRGPPADRDPDPISLEIDDWTVDVRPPTAADLVRLADDRAATGATLLARCVTRARRGRGTVDAAELPGAVVEAVSAALAEADPAADLRIELRCPACDHAWEAPFDIVEAAQQTTLSQYELLTVLGARLKV